VAARAMSQGEEKPQRKDVVRNVVPTATGDMAE
jgi:hypothetical protein